MPIDTSEDSLVLPTHTAVHRCLRVSEIFGNMIGYVVEDEARRRTLNALARTCKLYSPQALDELWRTQDSIVPLIKCMPNDLWTDENSNLKFLRPIFPTDWTRFRFYATRIQELEVDDRISISIFRDLGVHSRGQYAQLLPNLHDLTWPVFVKNSLPYLSMFLNGNLRCLCLSVRPNFEPNLFRFGDYLSHAVPRLEELSLVVWEEPEDPYWCNAAAITSSALQLRQLKSFKWQWPLGPMDIMHLAELPCLDTLEIRLSNECADCENWPAIPIGRRAFPALVDLIVLGRDVAHCTTFMKVLGRHSLESLELSADVSSGIQEAHDMVAALQCVGNRLGHDAFKQLTIYVAEENSVDYVLDFDLIRKTLLQFTDLENLVLTASCLINGNNDDLEELAQAWPKIDMLELGRWPWHHDTRFTIDGLSAFARYCPRLTILIIGMHAEMDESEFDESDDDDETKGENEDSDGRNLCRNESLRELVVGNSSITNPRPVAKLLHRMFPRLKTVEGEDLAPTPERNRWEIVQDWISNTLAKKTEELPSPD
ncbi:hypothetical protein NEOLEDRAFT_1244329 [Neolentinus lepideus HHB14362 ss-1]|uniref:F-box domain-containing protein n=1 Tax=Neolentinus lepideus HHB14362 ss-1 TaxID=1314782 RepID=A0A165Q3X9_9AGAM|nr:hypothetical protein NEOLEDRAFT_1244329 [Neolentinus lepideus HHB14362 ss-1]